MKSRLKAGFYSSGIDLTAIEKKEKVPVKVQGGQVYLRVPVHFLESQMSAVETLPDCFSQCKSMKLNQ